MYPVHSAARTGDLDTLKVLKRHNAKLDSRNALQQTPMFLAAQNDHKDVIQYVERKNMYCTYVPINIVIT